MDKYCKQCGILVDAYVEKKTIMMKYKDKTFFVKSEQTFCDQNHDLTTKEQKQVIIRKSKIKYFFVCIVDKIKKIIQVS